MACSCSSTSFKSFTAAAPSSASSSRSSSPASVSFLHHHQQQHHIPYPSCGSKHALLRWDCEKNTKQAHFHFSVAAKQGQGHYDKAKNTSQRGGGRGAGVAVKEDKTNRKGGNSGGKNPRPNNSNPNPRSYDNNLNPRSYNSSSSNRSGGRLSVVTVEVEDEDEDEDEDDDGSLGNPRSYNRSSDNNRNSKSYNTGKGGIRQAVLRDEEEEEDDEDEDDSDFDDEDDAEGSFASDANAELAIMPIPPAGFVLADDGSVSLMAPPHKRVTALVDSETKLSLDCLIRRVFSSSDGRQCFLLCPLDTPVQILRIEDGEVLKEISDEELEDIFPTASYELAKRRLHLVHSGFCLTLRGGFCYSDDDVIDLNTVYGGESGDSSLNEGVEVANFLWNGSEYLIFTPVDPLMFVSYRDNKTGELLIADDDLLDDEAVLDAIDEEKEFQAYMEEDSIMDDSATEDEEEEE